MDNLAELLETSFKVSNDVLSTSGAHPRFSQYKSKAAGASDQDVRRKRVLDQQKQSRYDYLNHVRNLSQGRHDSMDTGSSRKQQGYRGGKTYRDQLMLSEWMVEVPDDFEERWVMVPCPVGKRALVVASDGQTSSWSKGGWMISRFTSFLPGGSKTVTHWRSNFTVLDCIFCELTKTYYVLDLMCWKEQPHYDCDTEFRFYWLATKFAEYPQLGEITKVNKFRFEVLPNYHCSRENLKNVLHTKMNIQLDGLLFYHKETHYTLGSTPLVTWLKPYMMPDILRVEVSEEHMKYKPVTYTSFEAHLEQVQANKIKQEERDKARLERKRNRKSNMDTSDISCEPTTSQNPVTTSTGHETSEASAVSQGDSDDVVIEEVETIADNNVEGASIETDSKSNDSPSEVRGIIKLPKGALKT